MNITTTKKVYIFLLAVCFSQGVKPMDQRDVYSDEENFSLLGSPVSPTGRFYKNGNRGHRRSTSMPTPRSTIYPKIKSKKRKEKDETVIQIPQDLRNNCHLQSNETLIQQMEDLKKEVKKSQPSIMIRVMIPLINITALGLSAFAFWKAYTLEQKVTKDFDQAQNTFTEATQTMRLIQKVLGTCPGGKSYLELTAAAALKNFLDICNCTMK